MSIRGIEKYFDWQKFNEGKEYTVTGSSKWKKYGSEEILGTKVEVAITADKVPYSETQDGRQLYNLYEKLTWKIAKEMNFPIGTVVIPVGVTVTLWASKPNGPKDQMSIQVTDIKAAQHTAPVNGGRPTAPVNSGKALG